MSYVISMVGDQLGGQGTVYLKVDKLENETIFKLDRKFRECIRNKPRLGWDGISAYLANYGFTPITSPDHSPVYTHPRAWDEHLNGGIRSFFVTFPEDAPYELAGKLLFATSRPQNYATVNADYIGRNKVIIITDAHEPVYYDDLAWEDSTHAGMKPIGPVTLIPDQFSCEKEYELAIKVLTYSGYSVQEKVLP